MRAIDLRGVDAGEAVNLVIKKFFRALGKGNFATASALVSDPFDLFGTQVPRKRFADGDDNTLGRVVERLDELPHDLFSADEHTELFGGPLKPAHRVFFATVGLGEGKVTYGLVIDEANKVARLFDPTAFKAFAANSASDTPD